MQPLSASSRCGPGLEFYIFDPHGNLLRFGCAPEEVGDTPFPGARKTQ